MTLLVGILMSSCQPKSIATPTTENLPLITQNETITQPTQGGEPYVQPEQRQPDTPTPEDKSPYPSPDQVELAKPPTEQSLPNTPTIQQGVDVFSLYPGPSQGVSNFLDWAAAKEMILDGKVSKIYNSRNHVTLVLKDGNVGLTIEPAKDEVLKVIEQCGEVCADLEQITD